MSEQMNIFECLSPRYHLPKNKKIRLIELFAGYGSQALGLKYLGIPFEHHRICEWAVKSIQAYKDLHFTDEEIENNMEKEELATFLFQKGISADYNQPMSKQQIDKLSIDKLKQIYNNIQITHNLVNIQQAHGEDFGIVDKERFTYLLTYSFPCQDLSIAGLQKGMGDTSTRSGMLWEVERILTELKGINQLPDVLLMENVTQVHGTKFNEDFRKWHHRLEQLGYTNYWNDMNAKDYEIPQNRDRTFMVSVLGDFYYQFPQERELKLRLKDMLEDDVDEKYYLKDSIIEMFVHRNEINEQRGNGFKFDPAPRERESENNHHKVWIKSR